MLACLPVVIAYPLSVSSTYSDVQTELRRILAKTHQLERTNLRDSAFVLVTTQSPQGTTTYRHTTNTVNTTYISAVQTNIYVNASRRGTLKADANADLWVARMRSGLCTDNNRKTTTS